MSYGGRGHSYFGRGHEHHSDPDYRSRSRERSVVSSRGGFSGTCGPQYGNNFDNLNLNNLPSAASVDTTAPLGMELPPTAVADKCLNHTASHTHKMANKTAVVKEPLSDKFGILENFNESWLCFFTTSEVMSKHGSKLNLRESLPPGTQVGVNTTLIDKEKKIKVDCQ